MSIPSRVLTDSMLFFKSKAKMMKKESVWWYYIFAMLVVNSYLLYNDMKATGSVEDEAQSLKQFVLNLCDELLRNKTSFIRVNREFLTGLTGY